MTEKERVGVFACLGLLAVQVALLAYHQHMYASGVISALIAGGLFCDAGATIVHLSKKE